MKLAKHSINKLCCHEIYKSTNGKTGPKGAKRSTNRERFTSPPTWHPFVNATAAAGGGAAGAAAVCRSVGVACLAGHAANKRAATATAATATAAAKQRPRPDAMRCDAIQAGRTDGCGFVGFSVCDRCPLPQLPLVIFKTATADDGHGNEIR